ncbi:MAG: 23S rRNA (guanosine(2251)-2'-O)-methyltransferase RlmB [Deltaproteobacteria bacterium]|nr:MAG: 23S rRNA (guanosine(2251)-2'-O)-methyltransferase RlmB [Deltaproteobacteria bacterium]
MARVVYGVGPVSELLERRPRSVAVVYVHKPDARVAAAAARRGVDVQVRSRAELDALAGPGARHQGVVALAGEFAYADFDDVLAAQPSLIVALDSVQDPHNLGAIVRSAYLLGADAVVVPKDRAARVTAVATKASAGATEHMPIARVTNLARALADAKRAGMWVVGVASHPDAQPLSAIDATDRLCLVVGAEGSGIRPLVQRACDRFVEIPMAGAAVGSFNVSVAAAIALYEVARQRVARGA